MNYYIGLFNNKVRSTEMMANTVTSTLRGPVTDLTKPICITIATSLQDVIGLDIEEGDVVQLVIAVTQPTHNASRWSSLLPTENLQLMSEVMTYVSKLKVKQPDVIIVGN